MNRNLIRKKTQVAIDACILHIRIPDTYTYKSYVTAEFIKFIEIFFYA